MREARRARGLLTSEGAASVRRRDAMNNETPNKKIEDDWWTIVLNHNPIPLTPKKPVVKLKTQIDIDWWAIVLNHNSIRLS
jgi:hypothetical protein